jgi:hypothetical protein
MKGSIMKEYTLCTCGIALVAMAFASSPARAVDLPPAASTATFSGFRDPSSGALNCDETWSGAGSATCKAPTFYANGPLGVGIHIFGSDSATALVTGGVSPKAQVNVSLSGGDQVAGAGSAEAEATLDYFFTVVSLAPPPTTVADIPLSFTDSGSLNSAIPASFGVVGSAATVLNSFTGGVTVGSSTFAADSAFQAFDGSNLFKSYGQTYRVDFHFSGLPNAQTPVAHVGLDAQCTVTDEALGSASGDCTAIADPFVGFDQAAFDQLMGDKTFNLSDFFKIEVSSGLEAAAGVPEPASWALMIAGFGLTGAMLRRRKAQAA